MVDSPSNLVVQRWSRRVASLAVRSILAALSVVVLVYGVLQLAAVILRAMLPVSMSVSVPVAGEQSVMQSVSVPLGKVLTVLETLPPVHIGVVSVDPVLSTSSILTVGVAVGFTIFGYLGIVVASIPFQFSQRPSSLKEAGLLVSRNTTQKIRAVFHTSQSEVAEVTEALFVLTGASVLTYWTASEILLPMVVDGSGFIVALLLQAYILVIPVFVLFCMTGTVLFTIWYVGLRWKSKQTSKSQQ